MAREDSDAAVTGRHAQTARQSQEETGNSLVYRRARKMLLAGCSYCGWHRGENEGRRVRRSWKRHRKTQYRQ